MKPIEELDRNFALNQKAADGLIYYDVWQSPFQIYGIVPNEEKSFCRLPLEILPAMPEGEVRELWSGEVVPARAVSVQSDEARGVAPGSSALDVRIPRHGAVLLRYPAVG